MFWIKCNLDQVNRSSWFFDLLSTRLKKMILRKMRLKFYFQITILYKFKLKNLSYSYSAISELYNSSSVSKNAFLKDTRVLVLKRFLCVQNLLCSSYKNCLYLHQFSENISLKLGIRIFDPYIFQNITKILQNKKLIFFKFYPVYSP